MNRVSRVIVAAVLAAATASAFGQNGTIKGKVNFKGDKPPKFKELKMGADKYCENHHANDAAKPRPEYFVVNPNNTVRDVFVYIKSGLPKQEWPKPAKTVLDQVGCMYVPHVLGVMAGQEIEIKNSDATSHNIHALPKANAEFNFGQTQKGMTKVETFKNPEMAIKIKCDVHPWMAAWCHVMTHPFFAVTNVEGTFEIKDVPPGEYELAFWQERSEEQVMKVKVGPGETKEVNLDLEYKRKGED